MLIDDKMVVNERRKYLKLVAPRYAMAGRVERSALLTEMQAVTGLHRKSLLRLMHGPTLERAPKRPQVRSRPSGAAVAPACAAGPMIGTGPSHSAGSSMLRHPKVAGAGGGIRTPGFLLGKQTLYH